MRIIPYPEEAKKIPLQSLFYRITPVEHVQVLCWLAQQQKGNILEIGCNEGITTADFANLYPDRTIYAVDYVGAPSTMLEMQKSEQPSPEKFCQKAHHFPNVRPLNCHSAHLDPEMLEDVGFIFIDGDHSYEAVLHDSELALYTISRRGSGVIVWHDFYIEKADWNHWVGVKPYIDECLSPVFEELTYIENTCLIYLKL